MGLLFNSSQTGGGGGGLISYAFIIAQNNLRTDFLCISLMTLHDDWSHYET